jgi:hypothetical protein
MPRVSPQSSSFQHPKTSPEPLSVPVILDGGDQARVVTVAFRHTPAVGDRFHLQGTVWEITRVKDFQRGYVAKSVRPGFCVH